jgi:hypothetical protein
MRPMKILLVASLLVLCGVASASARTPSLKKSIWGDVTFQGKSEFPIYRDLGVGIFQMATNWANIAPTRPLDPTNPNDPAYQWPAEVDTAIAEGKKYGIKVMMSLTQSPPWANGQRNPTWAPNDPQDFADFVTAASRRWPAIGHWLIWGEPCRGDNFHPQIGEKAGTFGQPLNAAQKQGPHTYARILDAAYGAIKGVQKSDLVVGGNCFTGTTSTLRTDISPLNWMRNLRLPNGKPPRMDLYGHNAISARRPDLKRSQVAPGSADFSDLDLFQTWLDRYIKKGMRIFLSEWVMPTDHFGQEVNYYVNRKTAAQWTAAALKITRRTKRIYSFGWLRLRDSPPNASGDEATYGLLEYGGKRKPAYAAFRDG